MSSQIDQPIECITPKTEPQGQLWILDDCDVINVDSFLVKKKKYPSDE